MADNPEPAAYRVEHAKGDPSFVARIVFYGFESASEPHAIFRDAAIRQAAARGVTVSFGPEPTNGRVDAIVVSETCKGVPGRTELGHGAPVFALTRAMPSNVGSTASIILPPEPRSADYAEAGRRAIDLIADYLRGINGPDTVRLAHHPSRPSHAFRNRGRRPERTR